MGEIFEHNTGKALNRSDSSGQLLSYITTSNLYWDRFVLEDVREMYFENNEIAKCTAHKGDLLVCEGGDIGRAAIWPYDYDIRIQNHIHKLRGYLPLNNRFFLHILRLYKMLGMIGGKGIGLLGLSSGELEKMPIPLPPINEQDKIVSQTDLCLSLVDDIDRYGVNLISLSENTKAKILSLAISGKLVPQDPSDEPAIELLKRINPGFKPCDNSHYEDLPIGWSICTLYDICDTINGLWKGKNPPFVNVGVIRNANFTKDFNLDYSKIEYIDVEQRAFEKRNLEDGDLIVEKSGGSDNFPVGRSILYQGESGKYSFSNFTMALRIKDKNLIRSRYLYFVILHKYLSGEMRQMQTQTTGLHNLLSDKYMSMPIPIPPTKEQDRIIDSIEKLLNKIKTVL